MKLYTGMLYVAARLQVLWALKIRRAPSTAEHEDMLPASLIPSVLLGDASNRVLAEIDQDGFVFVLDRRDAELFNTREVMSVRKHHRIQIVLSEGLVLLRKTTVRTRNVAVLGRIREFLRWEFYIEAAALLRLRGLACVPTIRRVDCREAAIEMDYIWGRDLRQMLAKGADEIEYDEISRQFSALVIEGNRDRLSSQILDTVIDVIEHGVIPRDVHAANFVQGKRSGRLYLVDFNLAYLYPVPGWRSHVEDLKWMLGGRLDEMLRRGL